MTITSYVYMAILIALAGIVAAAFTRIGAAADRQTESERRLAAAAKRQELEHEFPRIPKRLERGER